MKIYWKGFEELREANDKATGNEFPHELPIVLNKQSKGSSRRDFLKTFGFTIAGATIAASCERPITKAIPFLIKPEEIIPGKSNYYASTFFDGELHQSILVKVRDGRPIKIEGNDLAPMSNGGTNGIVQGSVLELYDNNRYRGPLSHGEEVSWEDLDKKISEQMAGADGKIVLLSGGIISPTTNNSIKEFLSAYDNSEHIVYDPVSHNSIREANHQVFGLNSIPEYRFDKAEVILSFGADFLGTWISPTEFSFQYIQNRKPTEDNPAMSRHIQIESGMSMTGSNADQRITIKPSREKAILANLLAFLINESELDSFTGKLPESPIDIKVLAEELLNHKNKSLVICGSNDTESQMMVNGINYLLGSYGNTINFDRSLHSCQGVDSSIENLVKEMNEGKVSGIIFYNSNPAYDYSDRDAFLKGFQNLDFSISLSYTTDETSKLCQFVCPDHHFLESWNDAEPKDGLFSLCQPAIRNIFNTRQAQESLLTWTGKDVAFDDYLKKFWEENIYPLSGSDMDFRAFWNKYLHDGILEIPASSKLKPSIGSGQLLEILGSLALEKEGETELILYTPVSVGTGKHANNPWLQENPDPVSKVVWDNYAAVSPKYADENGLNTGDVIKINGKYEIPVLLQPGQMYGTISVALGYGREEGGKASIGTGRNFYPLVRTEKGQRKYFSTVEFEKTGKTYDLASTQMHHSMEGRALIRETNLDEYKKDPAAGNEIHEEIELRLDSLYEKHEFAGHHWGLSVDLSSCTGCNACVVACNAENNVPVVGKEQVKLGREMHWIRIDRYYSGDPESPEVLRQPVMCQHCDNAPCENVCPVAATTRSSEGVNQMIYNRCVGTRYCNNNCPYKVRRFNWFDFNKADSIPKNTVDPFDLTLDLPRMVLNPDVTVRAKGVMEKCTFCLQRVQEKKLNAKLEDRVLEDGEIKTACQQVCPTQALTFGDLNDENSDLSKHVRNPRNYHLLEEIHTLPSVSYLTKIRNKSGEA
ncbi:MAG TPA: 4Fe-4S dicluster domain-containing protein [Bacteroides sp.]|nr:4Fe-4S dicluster domain-containing protein [Bacteroides sp.]